MDVTVAYSPKHVGLASGLASAFMSPNKWVAGGFVVLGWGWDNAMTYVDRRKKKDGNSDGN